MDKVGIIDFEKRTGTRRRMKVQPTLRIYQKRPRFNVIKLSGEKNVEPIESPDPHQEVKNIHRRSSTDAYEVIVKNPEDMRTTMMMLGDMVRREVRLQFYYVYLLCAGRIACGKTT